MLYSLADLFAPEIPFENCSVGPKKNDMGDAVDSIGINSNVTGAKNLLPWKRVLTDGRP